MLPDFGSGLVVSLCWETLKLLQRFRSEEIDIFGLMILCSFAVLFLVQ
jgi:hypothetical protein